MRNRIIATVILGVLSVCAVTAEAEEKYGIRVYDGAKYDASTSKSVSESMSVDASCYRTNDPVEKVAAFFKKQSGLAYMGGDKEGAMFKKGDVDVTIQSPWMDMKSGAMMKDTLISIVKQQ